MDCFYHCDTAKYNCCWLCDKRCKLACNLKCDKLLKDEARHVSKAKAHS